MIMMMMMIIIIIVFVVVEIHTRKTFDIFTTKTAILGTSHIIRKVLQSET